MMLRQLHTYLSIASAPIILFFCLTGALQLFNWHEPRGAYHPPALIEKLGMLHKKQRFAVRGDVAGGRGNRPGSVADGRLHGDAATRLPGGQATSASALRVLLLRWVFLFATLCLVASSLMGLWIGLTHARRRRLGWLLLLLGAALPALMVAL